MPLSFGIPLGVFIALVGAILLIAKKYKPLAVILLGVGLGILLITVVLIVLAVNSSM